MICDYCEKCMEFKVSAQIYRLVGGNFAELCPPCQREWNRLVMESPEYRKLKRDEFARDVEIANTRADSPPTVTRDLVVNCIEVGLLHFLVLSERWLAQKPAKLAEKPGISQADCNRLNAWQRRNDRLPYTCRKDSNHEPLFATPTGWKCTQCDYRQPYSDEPQIVGLPPKAIE